MAEVTLDQVRKEFLPNTVGPAPRYTRESFQAYLREPNSYLEFEAWKAQKKIHEPTPQAEMVPVGSRDWQTWKALKNDKTLKSADDFRKTLKKAKRKTSDWGNDILGRCDLSEGIDADEYELVRASGRDLGFDRVATTKEIYDRANQLGLDLCPARVGPLLRMDYGSEQPNGEWNPIAMKAVAASDGVLLVFDVKRDGGDLWLHACNGLPDLQWFPDRVWVFLRRKS